MTQADLQTFADELFHQLDDTTEDFTAAVDAMHQAIAEGLRPDLRAILTPAREKIQTARRRHLVLAAALDRLDRLLE
jgi:hypothetical protein